MPTHPTHSTVMEISFPTLDHGFPAEIVFSSGVSVTCQDSRTEPSPLLGFQLGHSLWY